MMDLLDIGGSSQPPPQSTAQEGNLLDVFGSSPAPVQALPFQPAGVQATQFE